MSHKFLKILCITDHYLPGFKGGGPIRTLVNLRKLLAKDVEIAIFTRDRDLGSQEAYPGIRTNEWLKASDGPIYYADPGSFNAKGLRRASAGLGCDILYLNSFFGYRSSISPYLAFRPAGRRLPILLAPRGEFSAGALSIKRAKKRVFLTLARWLGLYQDVQWHASTALEQADILRQFPRAAGKIHLAVDPVVIEDAEAAATPKPTGGLRIAFISRISPMKNLDGLLQFLAAVTRPVVLSIYGPIEDAGYWQKCQSLVAALPANITVQHFDPLPPDEVSTTFARHDLFAFPTHGENFGHVIFEALRVGTPVLVSDQTPWTNTPQAEITAIPLTDAMSWRTALETAADRTTDQQTTLRAATLAFAKSYAGSPSIRSDNLRMFQATVTIGPNSDFC